jgi:hypothetical protein
VLVYHEPYELPEHEKAKTRVHFKNTPEVSCATHRLLPSTFLPWSDTAASQIHFQKSIGKKIHRRNFWRIGHPFVFRCVIDRVIIKPFVNFENSKKNRV